MIKVDSLRVCTNFAYLSTLTRIHDFCYTLLMEKKYYPVVGLEIHAELNTLSKMFCLCKNEPHQDVANTHVCPTCLAHPGTLPIVNKEAIKKVIQVGLALKGNIADFSEFDRKNYFYPDIPKGYQISQYKFPFVSGGHLAGVNITRVHLEEDTGTSEHKGEYSLVDYNRAGVPLMELVTEPCIHDSKTAIQFGEELQLLLRYLGVSSANMEKGEMRVEVNVSISPDPNIFGTKVEVKNINSFNMAGRAIDYEIKRMTELYNEGRESEIVQETRGWDDGKQSTYIMRKKENSDDYRYFPDPDIPKIYTSKLFDIEDLKVNLLPTPEQKREWFDKEFGIKVEDREVFIYNKTLGEFFEAVMSLLDKQHAQLAANYITSDISGILKSEGDDFESYKYNLTPEYYAELIGMNVSGELTSRVTKDILLMVMKSGWSPRSIAERDGLITKNDPEALRAMVNEVIAANPKQVFEYKAGKESLMMFFVGAIMKISKGSAAPDMIKQILLEELTK